MNGSISFEEVRLEEDVKQVSGQPFNSVVYGQNVDPLAVLDIGAGSYRNDIAQSDSQVVADHSIHANLFIRDRIVGQHNADSLLPLLAFENDSITFEQLELVHFFLFPASDKY